MVSREKQSKGTQVRAADLRRERKRGPGSDGFHGEPDAKAGKTSSGPSPAPRAVELIGHLFDNGAFPAKWSVGVVVARSATGETCALDTLAEKYGLNALCVSEQVIADSFKDDESVVANRIFYNPFFGEWVGVKWLGASGLNKIPSWLRPFAKLFGGEQ